MLGPDRGNMWQPLAWFHRRVGGEGGERFTVPIKVAESAPSNPRSGARSAWVNRQPIG